MSETPRPSRPRSSRASTRSAVEEVAQLAVAGTDRAQVNQQKLGLNDAVAKETPVDAIRGVAASARMLDSQGPSTAGRTFSARSTATGFASGASDVTHIVLREGEGEASTPRLQRAEAKRAAQSNLKRKLEKLAAQHKSGTFLAPRMEKRWHEKETEIEVEQGREVTERAVFKTPPRSAFAIAADGDVSRLRTVPGDDKARETEFRLDHDAGAVAGDLFNSPRMEKDALASPGGLDVLPDIAGALNAQCMTSIANAGVIEANAAREGACAEENEDGCSVASDTGAGEDGTREHGDLADAFAGEEDANGSGRRTLRNLLVRHVNTGIASDAVSLVPARLANRGGIVGAHEARGATAEGGDRAGDGDGARSARAAIRKTVAAKERRAFDSPPRAGHGKSSLFRGRSGGNLRNLVASERRASASPSGSEGFAFIGTA